MSRIHVDNANTLIVIFTTEHMYRIARIEKAFGIKWDQVQHFDYKNGDLRLKVDGVWKSADIDPDQVYGDGSMADDIYPVEEELDDAYSGGE